MRVKRKEQDWQSNTILFPTLIVPIYTQETRHTLYTMPVRMARWTLRKGLQNTVPFIGDMDTEPYYTPTILRNTMDPTYKVMVRKAKTINKVDRIILTLLA
jgi:hypothetical protein